MRVILPFSLRIFPSFYFSSQKDMLVSNIRSHLQERLEMGFDSENKWDGRGRGKMLPFCFFRQALTELTDGVFKFFSHSSLCGHVINGGIMALVGKEWMGGERGGVVREVREHSSVPLTAVNFLSFPIPLLRLCWGKIKMFGIFVSFTRFCCPLALALPF